MTNQTLEIIWKKMTRALKKLNKHVQLWHGVSSLVQPEPKILHQSIKIGSGIKEGKIFKDPIIEFYYKNDELNDPIVNNSHIISFGWSDKEELFKINQISFNVNKILKKKFEEIAISLIDFKLEFGRKTSDDSLVVADEISPDSCRLCDVNNKEKFDKDIFRYNKGNLVEAYKKLLIRLGIIK